MLGLKAVNCQSGETLTEDQVTAASKEQVLDALGEAASKLRGELGESLATVQKFDVPLEQATTSSLEALKAYSLGTKANRERGAAVSLTYHQRSIELDPKFAMGYRAIGYDYNVRAAQIFFGKRVDIVAKTGKNMRQTGWKIFVELDFHRTCGIAGTGRSSCAEAAAKAIAA